MDRINCGDSLGCTMPFHPLRSVTWSRESVSLTRVCALFLASIFVLRYFPKGYENSYNFVQHRSDVITAYYGGSKPNLDRCSGLSEGKSQGLIETNTPNDIPSYTLKPVCDSAPSAQARVQTQECQPSFIRIKKKRGVNLGSSSLKGGGSKSAKMITSTSSNVAANARSNWRKAGNKLMILRAFREIPRNHQRVGDAVSSSPSSARGVRSESREVIASTSENVAQGTSKWRKAREKLMAVKAFRDIPRYTQRVGELVGAAGVQIEAGVAATSTGLEWLDNKLQVIERVINDSQIPELLEHAEVLLLLATANPASEVLRLL